MGKILFGEIVRGRNSPCGIVYRILSPERIFSGSNFLLYDREGVFWENFFMEGDISGVVRWFLWYLSGLVVDTFILPL